MNWFSYEDLEHVHVVFYLKASDEIDTEIGHLGREISLRKLDFHVNLIFDWYYFCVLALPTMLSL